MTNKKDAFGFDGVDNRIVKAGKCDVRLDENEMAMLEKLADIEEVTKSDIMRKGLRLLHRAYMGNKE